MKQKRYSVELTEAAVIRLKELKNYYHRSQQECIATILEEMEVDAPYIQKLFTKRGDVTERAAQIARQLSHLTDEEFTRLIASANNSNFS